MENKTFPLSIIIPALNEEQGILPAAATVREVIGQQGIPYELILIDDGSSDGTGRIMDDLAGTEQFVPIKVIHNQKSRNVGYAFWQGVQEARGTYVMMVAGDNETSRQTLINVVARIGAADLIISYPANPEVRSRLRRIVSRTYVIILNGLFRLRLRYFNGTCLIRCDLLKRLPPWTPSFAFMAEILIPLIKSGATYEEMPIRLQPRLGGQSKAFSFRNIILTVGTIGRLLRLIYF